MTHRPDLTLHASAVAVSGRGVLITGASGSGKSTLALALMARGAELVSDDRVCLRANDGGVLCWAPAAIVGRIEARGIGLLAARPAPPAPVTFTVDLDLHEPERLPPRRRREICGIAVPLIHGAAHPGLADALLQLLRMNDRITA